MAKTLIVEGWRFLPHSYAVVNQWQLLALKRRNDIDLKCVDLPYFGPKWQRQAGLLDKANEDLLKSIPLAHPGESADVNFRLAYPFDFTPSHATRTAVFGTLEFQVVRPEMVANRHSYERARQGGAGIKVVTPSRWSAAGFAAAGFAAHELFIIPHGVDPATFRPMPEHRDRVRTRLNLRPDDFVFLAVGNMTLNKGMDLLLAGFAEVHRKFPHARLVLKGLDTLYDSKGRLSATIERLPQADKQTIIANARYSGAAFSFAEMAMLYQAADVLVAPYRAEGFNIPVLEAAACGLPVICTRGGPTDDFVTDDFARRIDSRKTIFAHDGCTCTRLDPDGRHLTALMMSALEDDTWRKRARIAGPAHVRANFTWDIVVDRLVRSLWG